MSLEQFDRILDEGEFATEVHLFNRGESLLHPEITSMITHAKSRGFRVSLHSNLNVSRTVVERAIDAGLDELSASIDGVSQVTYSQYRHRGDIRLCLGNLQALAAAQTRGTIRVIWQFLVSRFNEHELTTAQRLSLAMGVDFHPLPIGVGDDIPDNFMEGDLKQLVAKWAARRNPYAVREEYGGYYRTDWLSEDGHCRYLATAVTIHPDLNVGPCCMTVDPASDFGNLRDNSLQEVLGNSAFRKAHSLFSGCETESESTNGPRIVCERCIALERARNPVALTRKDPTASTSTEALVMNPALRAFLAEYVDEKTANRIAVANEVHDHFADSKEAGFFRGLMPRIRIATALNIACDMVLLHERVAMVHRPAMALLALGSGAQGKDTVKSDVEFSCYSMTKDSDMEDVFLPGVLGLLLAVGYKVDPWCAVNVLFGHATGIPQRR